MKKKFYFLFLLTAIVLSCYGQNNKLLIEAESFSKKGGWVVDPQFVEQMGSPYLLAHGMGVPVLDAVTNISIKNDGKYYVWVRTKNWVPGEWEAPGRFNLYIDKICLENELGTQSGWNWEYAGSTMLTEGDKKLSLHDLTGFEGRCDAIFITMSENERPPNEKEALKIWRFEQPGGIPAIPNQTIKFDLVVAGGGVAGCAASIAAAEQGLKVALIQDRPVLGGVCSGEIRIRTLGEYGKFERIIKMIDNTYPFENGSDLMLEDDKKRMYNVEKYSNIHIYLNFRAFNAKSENQKINYVDARHTSNGEVIRFEAPLFVDCTGHGWIGYWAGAEYMYGREAASTYNEGLEKFGSLWSPEKPDNFILGSTLFWNSENVRRWRGMDWYPHKNTEVPWAMDVVGDFKASAGQWNWEFSRNDIHQIDDAEYIRDHFFRAIYGAFYNYRQQFAELLNITIHDKRFKDGAISDAALLNVSHILAHRESRRLVGDYVYSLNDALKNIKFNDGVVSEMRHIDLHYQTNLVDPNERDFRSTAIFIDREERSEIPYRCLYSKNISNLFMAGRDFSCSHVGLATGRQMRSTAQMGAAVGLAAYLCKKYNTNPRDIYKSHLEEFLALIDLSNSADNIENRPQK